ncbi:hypothetical protein MSTO_25510 [Mycobacterium stomatepiae]|uniref:HTH marR-type domain-containing protein n=1 Tax=Mycobacterium stomatepiae TaxID=470076 RepID=A0A7I7Q8I2_9MYCO|nr:hypothetical protein MSTO_25510 [Mycobacterium stomatepiae]
MWERNDQTVGELVELLQLDYGTTTPLLKRLEKRGLVERTRSPVDRFDLTPNRSRTTRKMLQSIIEKAND